jgi:hypothetical protein
LILLRQRADQNPRQAKKSYYEEKRGNSLRDFFPIGESGTQTYHLHKHYILFYSTLKIERTMDKSALTLEILTEDSGKQ